MSKKIRNFSIVAHIDHGKSTLADRLLECTETIQSRKMMEQVLDKMDLERERGITIKAHTCRLIYKDKSGDVYRLNLIDTPGHVDFSYEVSRSLAACEGVVLVVDAAQGVEAQTIANYYLARENKLRIIPIINKIDLPNADIPRTKNQVVHLTGCEEKDIIEVSAKKGVGIEELLQAIINKIPAPKGEEGSPLSALIFDSFFDTYRGVVIYVRLFQGRVAPGMKIKFMSNNKVFEVLDVGVFNPEMSKEKELSCGEVGYIVAGIKQVKDVSLGDTVTDAQNPVNIPLPGYKKMQPMVFCGLYSVEANEHNLLREALEKLSLNDSSFVYEPEVSQALGIGFRCGFLGMLHMEIVQERLEREYNLNLIISTPNVVYQVMKRNCEIQLIENPSEFPPPSEIEIVEEPYIRAMIMIPAEYTGQVMTLCQERRGKYLEVQYLDKTQAILRYELPLSSVIVDFYDKLKSMTRGYGSFDYELIGYRPDDLVKVDILINHEKVEALSFIAHKDEAFYRGRDLAGRLREIIPRQQFEVAIQAAIASRVIARETIKPYRKDVTGYLYGGDVTRKRKLLEKQKKGKKRMKMLGRVEIPQEAFMAVLKRE
ncbi:MAG: translation elongation factor 4 [bacterium]